MYYIVWITLCVIHSVQGHGRLVEPPSRSTMWRYGYSTPNNYNDHELYCGGYSRQYDTNGGKCGACGDPWDTKTPRPNESGGTYGQNVIVRSFKRNSIIEIGVELTANHNGHFEFSLCPQSKPPKPETEECFEKYVLQRADGAGTRYYPGPGSGIIFTSSYELPTDLVCDQCVLRWEYKAGNNWGTCANGTGAVGCGNQETFRACADIQITADGVSTSNKPVLPIKSTTTKPSRSSIQPVWRSTTPRSTTLTTTATESNEIDVDGFESSSIPNQPESEPSGLGVYTGIIIAACALLFAFLLIATVILYFWKGRGFIKSLLQICKPQKDPPKKKLTLPAHIASNYDDSKRLSLTISEPINVAINGVEVTRDPNHPV